MPRNAPGDDLVMSLVDLALAKPREERERFLRDACAGEPDLFTLAWSYVEWEDRMEGFMEQPLFQLSTPQHPFEPGAIVENRFQIDREIAQGGMGVVYEAWDRKLERRIAIKCAKTGFRKRLLPEVRHASEITHPNVCRIFEIHTTRTASGEVDFVTMEYLDGETLTERIRRGPVPEAEALSIARQLCAGLGAAHSQGVIHGDLKSSNVILTRSGDGKTRAALTDFGLARARETVQPSAQSGPRGGTPDYMAPELWKGEKATQPSDVYALGVLLRELVTGSRTAAPASKKWSSILARCLAEDPHARYASAAEVARALEPPQTRTRTRTWTLIAVAVLVAAITGVVTYQSATAPKQKVRLAMRPFEATSDVQPLAQDLLKKASVEIAKLNGTKEIGFTSVGEKRAGSATHTLHGSLDQRDGKIRIHVVLIDAGTQSGTGEWNVEYRPEELRYAPAALAGFTSKSLHLTPPAAFVSTAAKEDYERGIVDNTTQDALDGILKHAERAVIEDSDSPLTHAALAEAEYSKYLEHGEQKWDDRFQESVHQAEIRSPDGARVNRVTGLKHKLDAQYETAIRDYERSLALEPRDSITYRRLSRAYGSLNRPEEALEAIRGAVAVAPRNFKAHLELGAAYSRKGDYENAVAEDKIALNLAPGELIPRTDLATALNNLGRLSEAEAILREAVKMQKSEALLMNLGSVLLYEERDQEAVEIFKQASSLAPGDFLPLLNLGTAFRRGNQNRQARAAYQKSLRLATLAVEKDPRNGANRAYASNLWAWLGNRARAETEARQAVKLSPKDATTQRTVVVTYEAVGNREAALSVLSGAWRGVLEDLNYWPDTADLRADPKFQQLLVTQPRQ